MTTDTAGHSGAHDEAILWAKYWAYSAPENNGHRHAALALLAMSAELERLREDAQLLAVSEIDDDWPDDIAAAIRRKYNALAKRPAITVDEFECALRRIFNLPAFPAKAAQGD